jgi:hypothetical protein
MVAYSFKAQFVEPIIVGTKRQTIRADRKRHARSGEALQLYTGMRTRSCRLIGRALCLGVSPILLRLSPVGGVRINDVPWIGSLDEFAQSDGFSKWDDLLYFWELNHGDCSTFSGVLIRWTDFKAGGA